MADVDTWAPVDDDNNSAPPNGWPEGQMPSSVNNCARAMMGAVRRMYDKIVNGTLALPYLPLAGGTVTGNVAINGTGGVSLAGTQLRNISSGLEVYNASGGGITARGPLASMQFGDQNQTSPTWAWAAVNDVASLIQLGTGTKVSVTNAGAMSVATSIETDVYAIQGVNFAYRSGDGAHVIADGAGATAISLYSGGSYYRNGSHTFQNDAGTTLAAISPGGTFSSIAGVSTTLVNSSGDINATGAITAGGNITAGGQVQGNLVHSTGAVTAAGNVTAGGQMSAALVTSTGAISAASNIIAAGYMEAGYLHSTGDLLASGRIDATGAIAAGGQVSGATLFVSGVANINGSIATLGTVFAHAFVDTDGLLLVDAIKDLTARVAALEVSIRAP